MLDSVQHNALPLFNNALLYVIIPLTVLTLAVSFFMDRRKVTSTG